jgi:hypothetical protein
VVERTLTDGVYRTIDAGRTWFTTAYFHHPDETLLGGSNHVLAMVF